MQRQFRLRGGVAPKTTRLRGQSIIEYVLIIAVIGLVIVFAGPCVADAIRNQFSQVTNTVDSGTDGDSFMSAEEKAYRAASDIAALRPRLASCRRKARLVFRIPRAIEQMCRHEDDLLVQLVHKADSDAGDSHVDTENQFSGLGAELLARHQGRLHELCVEAEFTRVFISCHIHFLSS